MSGRLERCRRAAVVGAVVGSVVAVISVIVQQLSGSRRLSAPFFATSARPSILNTKFYAQI